MPDYIGGESKLEKGMFWFGVVEDNYSSGTPFDIGNDLINQLKQSEDR